MDIFISWSGAKSKEVAKALKEFLEAVLQATKPWVSAIDIISGDRWNEEISKKLAGSRYGIICLTKYNINSPWVLFEAGALAKAVDKKTYVCPYLVGFDDSQLQPPLSLFQAREANMEGTLQMIKDINQLLGREYPGSNVKDETLKMLFDKIWPDFEKRIINLPDIEGDEVPKRSLEDMIKEILEITRSINSPETKDLISLTKKVEEIEDNLSCLEADKDNLEMDKYSLEERVDDLENNFKTKYPKELKSLEKKVDKMETNLMSLEDRIDEIQS